MMAKEKPPITVVGDVGGRIAIIVVRLHALSPTIQMYIHAEFTALKTKMRTAQIEKLTAALLPH